MVANAPRIISDLKAFFPPQDGIFLIGPMAKIGWGTPTLVTVSLGVIIEIPGNIAILGVLRVALPTEDEAVLLLQVNFAGAIEFDKKRIYFFAALYQSRILTITIEGELGLLVAYGEQPDFVLTVGGFHPAFKPPPLPFPVPRRVSINILNSDNARIGVDGVLVEPLRRVVDTDEKEGTNAARLEEPGGGAVRVPRDAVARAPGVEDVLAVVQVEDGIATGWFLKVGRRQIDANGAVGPQEFGGKRLRS